MKKLRLSSKKTVKSSIINYTKMLSRTKGMTCNHTLHSRESFQPYMGYGRYWAFSPSAHSCISIGQNAHVYITPNIG